MERGFPGVEDFFPFWQALSPDHRAELVQHSQARHFKKGARLLPYRDECLGLVLLQQGQFRAYVLSEAGKEVTLYRLFALDICLFSASCIMNNIQFEIHIEVEKDTDALIVPTALYHRLQEQSIHFSNYTNQLMAARFSDVMWAMEQILFKSVDSRLAQALLWHASMEETDSLALTHELLAQDLGTAREVVTRMLKYFSSEGAIALTRGHIRLLNTKWLQSVAGET